MYSIISHFFKKRKICSIEKTWYMYVNLIISWCLNYRWFLLSSICFDMFCNFSVLCIYSILDIMSKHLKTRPFSSIKLTKTFLKLWLVLAKLWEIDVCFISTFYSIYSYLLILHIHFWWECESAQALREANVIYVKPLKIVKFLHPFGRLSLEKNKRGSSVEVFIT